VRVGGVTIRQASLHNFDDMHRKDIREGDTVIIKRAGDVIPQVLGPVADLRDGSERVVGPPDACPVCEEPVLKREGEVAIYCVNPSCPATVIRHVEHWASRGAMDIDGLGVKVAELLVAEGLVHHVADLYALTKEDLIALEGFGDKRAENLVQAIDASRGRPLWRVLAALGIPGIGSQVAQTLADHYESMDAIMTAPVEEMQEIPGIGPKLADSVAQFFARPRDRELIEALRERGVNLADEAPVAAGPAPLEGLTIVITGTLPSMSREAASALIQQHGGRVTGSVSGNTDYVLVGDKPGASKYDKALKLGVPLLDEEGLLALIGGQGGARQDERGHDAEDEPDGGRSDRRQLSMGL
jgi:DNA ligase (NAD+)